MAGFQVKRAKREMARARIGMCGASGAGKTMSALRLAKGLMESLIEAGVIQGPIDDLIGVVDTERKSASLYSDVVPFLTIEMEPPYSPERYSEAIDALERAGCKVIILDQISHAWAGPGGVLEYVDTLKAQARNAMSPWAKATPEQNRFVDRMLRSEAHIIATMRSKSEWVLEEKTVDGRKKTVPRKIGMAPVQRDGIEYEFTAMLDLDTEGNTAVASKDRTRLFHGQTFRVDEEWGRKLARWLLSAEATTPEPPRPATPRPAPTPPPAPTGLHLVPQDSRPAPEAEDGPENGFEPDGPLGPEQTRELWNECKRRAAELGIEAAKLLTACLDVIGRQKSTEVLLSEFPSLMNVVRTLPKEAV